MITVPEIVEKIVIQSPFLEEALSQKLINYSALARKLKPEIQKQTMKNIQEGAIVMALRRLAKKIKPLNSVNKILQSDPDLTVRSNLIECVIANSEFTFEKHKRLLQLIEEHKKNFMTITEGVFETTIIARGDLLDRVLPILDVKKITSKMLNLSSITIHLPTSNVYSPGLYYFFLKALAWEGINVVEVVSTYTELTLVLENKDVDRAFSVLKKLFIN